MADCLVPDCPKQALKFRRFCERHKIPANRPDGFVPPHRGSKPSDPYQWVRVRCGLTKAELDEMLAAQGGRCAVCRQSGKLVVDHDHDTGIVRGLLCRRCNMSMHVLDEPGLLSSLLHYKGFVTNPIGMETTSV